MTCDPYVPPVRTACDACPVPTDVVDMPKNTATTELLTAINDNFEVVRCLIDLCDAEEVTEALTTAAPAANVYGSSTIDSTANAVDATLADGVYIGQEKSFLMTEDSNSSTVTVANHATSAPEVFTFDADDEYLFLKWTGVVWVTVAGTATT